jgi:exonuclease III
VEPFGAALRIGSWNLSHWSPEKAERAAVEVPFDILAVQKTHLAMVPLGRAYSEEAALGLHFHHGLRVAESGHSIHERSCGVGFLTRRGLALSPVLPVGAAGRRLHAQGRWHAVRLEPRPDLPRGLLLVTVYAPLESQDRRAAQLQWNALMLERLHGLGMQVPTLLLGDFNRSMLPSRDFLSESGGRRAVCPLLAALLGPGGAWLDVHATLLRGPLPWTFQLTDTSEKLSASRLSTSCWRFGLPWLW